MKFDSVIVIESCVPGLQAGANDLVVWFDGSGPDAPVYLKHGDKFAPYWGGWVKWEKGTSIAQCLELFYD